MTNPNPPEQDTIQAATLAIQTFRENPNVTAEQLAERLEPYLDARAEAAESKCMDLQSRVDTLSDRVATLQKGEADA